MPKKIVLAYSGGLDTSVILKWLQNKYECPVVTFTADIGQGDELSPIEAKAKNLGAKILTTEKDYVKVEKLISKDIKFIEIDLIITSYLPNYHMGRSINDRISKSSENG